MRRRHLSLIVLAVSAAALCIVRPAFPGAAVTTMQLGSTFTVSGHTGSAAGHSVRALGKVVVSGRWGSGPWHVLTTTRTDETGNYEFILKPNRRGDLTVRIAPPDHRSRRFLLHVY
jgi:hypothetical protein